MLKYKKLFKYYSYSSAIKLLHARNANLLLGNFYYYSNTSLVWYNNFFSNFSGITYFVANNYFMNIHQNNNFIKFNFNTLVLLNNIDFLTKFFFESCSKQNYFDLVYLKLLTHKKLISSAYLYQNILCKYGDTLYSVQVFLFFVLYNFYIRLLKLLVCFVKK